MPWEVVFPVVGSFLAGIAAVWIRSRFELRASTPNALDVYWRRIEHLEAKQQQRDQEMQKLKDRNRELMAEIGRLHLRVQELER